MFEAIENEMITRLRSVMGAQPNTPWAYKVATIESYGGQIAIDDVGKPSAIFSFSLPALFIALGERAIDNNKPSRGQMSFYRQSVMIYCVTYNARNESAQRRGDANEVGSWELAEDVAKIVGSMKMPEISGDSPLIIKSITPIFNAARNDAKALSMMVVNAEVSVVQVYDLPGVAGPWINTGWCDGVEVTGIKHWLTSDSGYASG